MYYPFIKCLKNIEKQGFIHVLSPETPKSLWFQPPSVWCQSSQLDLTPIRQTKWVLISKWNVQCIKLTFDSSLVKMFDCGTHTPHLWKLENARRGTDRGSSSHQAQEKPETFLTGGKSTSSASVEIRSCLSYYQVVFWGGFVCCWNLLLAVVFLCVVG